jgi:large subunit ribosomal protein L9
MKVILLSEMKGRGGEGDVIEVRRGYANNYLFPKHIAVPATAGNLKQLEQRRHNIEQREAVRLAEAGDFRGVLDGKKVSLYVKVGEAGRLFGSVTAAMIADAIHEQLGIEVDRRKIETHGVIKTVGEHDTEVSVYRDIKAHLSVEVVAEGTVAVSEEESALAAEVEAAKAGAKSKDESATDTDTEASLDEAVEELAEEVAEEIVSEEAVVAEAISDVVEAAEELAAVELLEEVVETDGTDD